MAGILRCWGPVVAGFACFVITLYVGAAVGWVLIIAGFGLILDGATVMWERAGGIGNLSNHHQ
jgi:hypothetical protein